MSNFEEFNKDFRLHTLANFHGKRNFGLLSRFDVKHQLPLFSPDVSSARLPDVDSVSSRSDGEKLRTKCV